MSPKVHIYYNGKIIHTVIGLHSESEIDLRDRVWGGISVVKESRVLSNVDQVKSRINREKTEAKVVYLNVSQLDDYMLDVLKNKKE